MRIIFFGSSDFSSGVLSFLCRLHPVSLVVTQHAKPAGRHYHEKDTPTAMLASSLGIPVFSPLKVNAPESVEHIRSFDPDIFIVISYGQILSSALLSCARKVPMAIHPSLLPRYRGASPINAVLLQGEPVTGVTLIKMNKSMDAGEIILQEQIPIDIEDTAITLSAKLLSLSCVLVERFLQLVKQDALIYTPQDPSQVTIVAKLNREHARIQWNTAATAVHNYIRGLVPWPVAFTTFRDEQIKIYESALRDLSALDVPGTVMNIEAEGIEVATGHGTVCLKKLQRPGKRVISAGDFAHGTHLKIGDRFI